MPHALRDRFRAHARGLPGLDGAVYETFGKDPLDPVIGLGDPDVPIAFFGRDPGRDEVRHGLPFIGAGGQKVRGAVYEHLFGTPLPDFATSIEVGRGFFWANTVPYKPLGNKAWSMAVKKQFQPLMAELLLTAWSGREVITLGREAFLWFGINQPKVVREALEAFWAREDRFEASIAIDIAAADTARTLRLHPLPHPSPLNATWYKRFPELLKGRLRQLGVERRLLEAGC